MRLTLLILLFNSAGFLAFSNNAFALQLIPKSSRLIDVDQHGLLSVEVKQSPLIDIVNAIKRQTGISFIVRTSGTQIITDRFTKLPLKQGLKRLFRDFNYALIDHEKKPDQHPRFAIKTIILLSRNFVTEKTKQIKTSVDTQVEPLQDFTNTDPEARRKVISNMETSDIDAYFSDLSDMLINDPDESVRAEVARAIASQGNQQSVEILFDALNDESDAVKNAVINAMASIGNDGAMKAFKTAVTNLD